jgi:hypothetical protein
VTVRFTHAMVRPPADTFGTGISMSGLDPSDLALAPERTGR